MDAIILAAGLGTRLRPYTLTTPKPLLPVQERPILDWTISALPNNVDRLIVVVHYLKEQVEDYLAKQEHIKNYTVVFQENPQGTGDAVRICKDAVHSESFMVLNGDDLFGANDLQKLSACEAGILTHPVDEPKKFGIVFPREDGSLEKLIEKPDLQGRYLANVGAYVLPKKIFEMKLELSARGEYEMTDYVHNLAETDRVEVVEASYWFPIGTEEAWNAAQKENLQSIMNVD